MTNLHFWSFLEQALLTTAVMAAYIFNNVPVEVLYKTMECEAFFYFNGKCVFLQDLKKLRFKIFCSSVSTVNNYGRLGSLKHMLLKYYLTGRKAKSFNGPGSKREKEQPSSHLSTLRLLKYKMADQMETEHLRHQQMLPWEHLAYSHLFTIISLITEKPVQHMYTAVSYFYSTKCSY